MRRARPLYLFLLLAGCTTGGGRMPARLVDVPWTEASRAEQIAVRQTADRGEHVAALAAADELLQNHPDAVDTMRLRQDLLRQRGRSALVHFEARQRLERAPDDPLALYLWGRLLPSGPDKEAVFRRAAQLGPKSFWPWLGLAFCLCERGAEEGLLIYRELYQNSGRHPIVANPYAQALRRAGRTNEAVGIDEALRKSADGRGQGEVNLARDFMMLGQQQAALRHLEQALRQRPFDPAVHEMLRSVDAMDALSLTLRERPELLQGLVGNGAALLAAQWLRRSQQPFLAVATLQSAAGTRLLPAERRLLRRMHLQVGDVTSALTVLAADAPMALLDDPGNRVRGRWQVLLDGPWRQRAPADADEAAALAAAWRDCGLLLECEQYCQLALLRWPDAAPVRAVHDEVRAELAFEGALRRLVYDGYGERQHKLEPALRRLREASVQILGRDVVGDNRRFAAPWIGEMIDPFTSDLCRHLERYNRHLVLGQRSGGTVEGLMVVRWSVRDLPDDPDQPLPARCLEVIGSDRDINTLTGVGGGDLAGVALLNHFVIDLDAIRDWAGNLHRRRRIAAEDGMALLHDPIPADVPDLEPLDAAWRLANLSPVQDNDLDDRVLDIVRRHERAHLRDSFHFLPFEANLWRCLGLWFRSGMSAEWIEAQMEGRAELAALANSPHTELVLSHIADFCEADAMASVHGRGFRDLAERLQARLRAAGVPDADCKVSAWHRLPMDVVRRVAREMQREAW